MFSPFRSYFSSGKSDLSLVLVILTQREPYCVIIVASFNLYFNIFSYYVYGSHLSERK